MPFRNDKRFEETGFFTATGKALLLDDPRPELIDLVDVAASLARRCRFGCNLKKEFEHYSVAEHSVLVAHFCQYTTAVQGLLHDAAEFALGDITRPQRRLMGCSLDQWFYRWDQAIGQRFGVNLVRLPLDVVVQDNRALATEIGQCYYDVGHEVRGFLPYEGVRVRGLPVREAYAVFLTAALSLGLYDGPVAWGGQ